MFATHGCARKRKSAHPHAFNRANDKAAETGPIPRL